LKGGHKMKIEVIPCDMPLKVTPRRFPNQGVIEIKLPEEIVDDLWKLIEESKKEPYEINEQLAGNISSSLKLDKDSPLLDDFNQKVIPALINVSIKEFGSVLRHSYKSLHLSLSLESLWVNFQNKHEFNPPHNHSGVYSFVIWMQIPTSFEEQSKLPIAAKSNTGGMISNFAFQYTDILGRVSINAYEMEKSTKGFMVLFPSNLTHQVFPFYENDGERISISGNLTL